MNHSFTLVLSGPLEITDGLENHIFEAGCDDALLGSKGGVLYLDFDREAPSFDEAVCTAIRDAEEAHPQLSVVRVEPDDLVTAAEIARRIKKSREYVRQLANGERGPGGFPQPISNLTTRSPIWSWREVAAWMFESLLVRAEEHLRAETVAFLNLILASVRKRIGGWLASEATFSDVAGKLLVRGFDDGARLPESELRERILRALER